MQADIVFTVAAYAIDDDPEVVLHEQHGAAVDAASSVPAEAVMLASGESPCGVVLETDQMCFRSVQHLELAMVEHLVATVDDHRVVAGRAHEVLMPVRGG